MILLFIDILLSFFSHTSTYFFLLNLLIPKIKLSKIFIITLIIDLLILNTYFLNTIIIAIIFYLLKKSKISLTSFKNYILTISLIYIIYILSIGLINKYSLIFLLKFLLHNYFYNIIFYILCYKILRNNIKLSR